MAQRPTEQFLAIERETASKWARRLLDREDFVVLDTETTGLGSRAQAVQIGVLSPRGDVIFDRLIRPTILIPDEAIAVHGITNELVADAYGYPAYHTALCDIFKTDLAIIYNAAYDVRIMQQTAGTWQLPSPLSLWECAMLRYARWFGEWNDYQGDFKWIKLPPDVAAAHNAINDCRATLKAIQRMAAGDVLTTVRP